MDNLSQLMWKITLRSVKRTTAYTPCSTRGKEIGFQNLHYFPAKSPQERQPTDDALNVGSG
jgi:hypothetical protein